MYIYKKSGFTVIEMLVSITILVTLATVVIANFRGGERKTQLNLAANLLLSNIRKLQNMVINGSDFNGVEMPYSGYGIYFESNKYTLFADNNANKIYDLNEQLFSQMTYNISVTVTAINNIAFNNLLFLPPKAQVCVNHSACSPCDCDIKNNGQYLITLTHSKSLDSLNIFIDQISGRVEIE